jgi:tetratricopeptide (TPR) repeat protein
MLRQSSQFFIRFCFVIFCAALSLAPAVNGEALPYRSYTAPEGTHYFALGLQASAQPAGQPVEVLFLVDTSAGQGGQARLDTLEAIVSAINHLPEGAKIQILAMDVETEPLTAQFAIKGSPEIESALKTLYRRVPLGATDFGKGLETVRKTFESGSKDARRAVLYLGGGRSMAKTISADVFEKEADAFAEQKISFTACAIGLRTNFGFISAFANRTGGNLIDTSPTELKVQAVDKKRVSIDVEKTVDWQKIGQQIADFATATVVWIDPASVKFPKDWTVYPVHMQPIRSDRATILVGVTESETLPAFDLALTGTTAEGQVALTMPLAPETAQDSNNYLRAVVETAARDGGAVMPIVGWNSLLQIQEMFIVNVEEQISKADVAMVTGNPHQAMTILSDVLHVEPGNKIAQNMFHAAQEQTNILPNVIAQNDESVGGGGNTGGTLPAPSAFVDAMMQERSVGLQKIQKEVEVAIVNAEKQARTSDPNFEGAIQSLKLTQQMVRNNTALAPASREALLDRLGNSLKWIEHDQYVSEYRDAQKSMDIATQRARREAIHTAQTNREKEVQIFDRFRALMETGEYKAATVVADAAVDLLPDHTAPHFARRMAQMMGYITEYEELRHKRHIGFLETFMDAERSFIPIPTEPPFTYIDRDRWKLLSDYRKEKYSSIALSDPDESVKTIKSILESRDIRLNIDETTTFSDLFRMIKDELRRLKLPDINIDMDRKALQDAGEYRSDSIVAPEGFDHPRMRLRSVLSRLLSPHDLTYIIRDETLLITTVEESRKRANQIIKMYPVGDIMLLEQSMMGGGMGGGMGGYGGGMGGMSGGMGGMGGMSGGMGGGMRGGMGGMSGGMGGMSGGMGGMSGGYGGGMGGRSGGMGGRSGGYGGYSVPDEITRSAVSETTKLFQDAKAAENCNDFWTNYFEQKEVNTDIIKDVVRRLTKEMQTNRECADQIVALVEAALLSGNAQPWMYEALTLALHLKGAPKAQVLRAALSAADFCDNPIDLLNVAFVMRSALDLKQYAFPLYRQALENLPPKRDLYAATLRLAEELFGEYDDEESLRWIALAVISQEWDGALGDKLCQDAHDLLTMLSKRMIKQNRNEEARQIAKEIQEAKLRDCVVTIEWTGDAGIDLMVREPSKSLCWFGNPRSTSGGLLKRTPVMASAKTGNPSAVKKISYVCPRGFNGWYSLILNKSWGSLSNDLVKVTVEANVVPGENKVEGVVARMHPEGIVIDFELGSGRRTESASEAELAAADLQMTVVQRTVDRNSALWRLQDDGVLGQTTDANTSTATASPASGAGTAAVGSPVTAANSAATANAATNAAAAQTGGATANAATVPVVATPALTDYFYGAFGSRYIGYEPVVELLPIGTSFAMYSGTTAVSPDRRYVLMSFQNLYFTALRSVSEYNSISGSTSTSSTTSTTGTGTNNTSTNRNNTTGNTNTNRNNTNTNSNTSAY